MRGLEIGGGPHPQRLDYEQFDAIDWRERTGLDYTLGDARLLPYEDGTFDIVFASNLLEHFPPAHTISVLVEWARVLRVGGVLELVVPDAMGILRDYFGGVNNWTDCAERLLGSQDYPGNEHKTAFTLKEFPAVLTQVRTLELLSCEGSHRGGGITSKAARVKEV